MNELLQMLKPALPCLYGLALVGYLFLLFGQTRPGSRVGTAVSALLLTTVILHATYEGILGATLGHHPMATIFQIFSVMALALASVYLWIEYREKNRNTGSFVLSFVAGLQLFAALGVDPVESIHPLLKTIPFGMHTGSITLAFASFFLSMIYALMLLLFYRSMRRKQFGLLFEKLPPLSSLARMNLGAALAGFIFMTLGIAFGLHWAVEKIDAFWRDPKIYFTFAIWLLYAVAIAGHFVFKWNDRRVALATLQAFLFTIIVTTVHHAFLGGWHRFIG